MTNAGSGKSEEQLRCYEVEAPVQAKRWKCIRCGEVYVCGGMS